MKKKFPEAKLKLPKKKLFGAFDNNYILNRRIGLHDFVQKILYNSILVADPDVKAFLNIDENIYQENEEDEEIDKAEEAKDDTDTTSLGPTEKKNVQPSDFEYLKVIGKGSFGKVFLASHKEDKTTFAIKVLKKAHIAKRKEEKHIISEKNVLIKCVKHPFLVGLHYSFQSKDKLYFVLNYVNGGELFFHLQKERCFHESRAKFYAAEIGSALGYLHGEDILYRDLKPENILLQPDGHICLTDFGLCKEDLYDEKTTSTFCGTPEYLAPEVLRKEPYDKGIDWWCFGSVLYEMIYGLPPFYSRDREQMYKFILHKQLQLRSNISAPAKDILENLLKKDKNERLGSQNDFLDIKNHPFFASINWKDLDEKKIKPPYDPKISGDMDFSKILPEFLDEPIPGSVSNDRKISASVQDMDNNWLGFTYVRPSDEILQE